MHTKLMESNQKIKEDMIQQVKEIDDKKNQTKQLLHEVKLDIQKCLNKHVLKITEDEQRQDENYHHYNMNVQIIDYQKDFTLSESVEIRENSYKPKFWVDYPNVEELDKMTNEQLKTMKLIQVYYKFVTFLKKLELRFSYFE